MKYFLILLLFMQTLFSNEQIVFVLADDFKTSKAKLVRYENIGGTFKKVSTPINVNLGKKGLGWGNSNFDFDKNIGEPLKKEGDKKAPAGIFNLSKIYTYENHIKTKMPYEKSTSKHICVDDSQSEFYNQIIKTDKKSTYKSYENMLLKNNTYKYVIVVNHNENKIKEKGSCIFLHVQNPKKVQTSGCTSMREPEIKSIISWLDIEKKPILIQIPSSSCLKMKEKYPFLECDLLEYNKK